MLSEEEQIQQIVHDSDAVRARAADQPAPEEPVDTVSVLVHFGYHGLRAAYERADPAERLGTEYADYCQDVYREVREDVENDDTAVVGLYPAGYEQAHRIVLGAHHPEVRWVPTWDDGAVLTDDGVSRFAEIYNRLDDGGTVTVHGEDGEKCYQYTVNFCDALLQRGDKDFEIRRGRSYSR